MSDSFYVGVAVWSQVVASLLFIVAMVVIWVRFIAPAVLASQTRKNAELLDAEKRRDDARAEAEKAQHEIATADADARAIAQRADSDASRLHDKTIADARVEGERLLRTAGGELDRARAAARDELRSDLLERAMQIARDAASRLDDGTNRRLVGDAVDSAERDGAD